ncbi:AAA family ATPase [Desemzia sp. RIT804]|uniref:ATP-binding protein n=1 Tax=Desemzia sp. RIT 804 TaxID=2810209 RepID=UPI0019523859|nr:AAA family ATPase [Desemzia sp. RIT 804]MBM6613413.1 AAA family ATPase [Desemzia sp. RIT 804]
MKIKEIEVYGYGKWVDKKFSDIDQLKIYYGKNEAGKTTLMSFIHSILFGFPTKQSSELRYEPKESTRYGGRLIVEDTPYGGVVIERVKGKANGDVTVTLSNGVVGSDDLLENLLYGIDKKTYQTLFSFDLDGLQDMQKMNQKKLNRYFLSIGTLGNEQLLRVADKFEKQANELFKPTGRKPEINQKIRQVESKRKQLQKAKDKNQQYMEYYTQKIHLEDDIQTSKEKRNEMEETISHYQRLNLNWNHYAEMQSIHQQIVKEKLADLPEEGLYQLNNLQERMSEIKDKITGIHEELMAIQEKQEPSRKLSFYFNNEQLIEELLVELEDIQQQAIEQEQLQTEVHQLEQELIQAKFKAGLSPDSPVPASFTDETRHLFSELSMEWQDLEKKYAAVKEKARFLNYQNQSLYQQLDLLEQQLWNQDRFQEAEKVFKKQNEEKNAYTTSKESQYPQIRNQPKKMLPLVFGVLVAIVGLIMNNALGYSMIVIGAIITIWALKSLLRKSSKISIDSLVSEKEEPSVSYESFVQQKEIKKQWQEKLAENDQVTFDLNQVRELEFELDNKLHVLKQQERALKEEYSYPLSFSVSEFERDADPYQSMRETDQQIRLKEQRIAVLEQSVYSWRNQANILEAVIFLDWNSLPSIINGVKHYKEEVTNERIQRNQLLQTEKEIHIRLQHWDKQQKELEQHRTKLFRSIQVKDEDEFRRKYILFQNLTDKKNRLNVLENQLAQDITLYNQFKDQTELQEKIQQLIATIQTLKEVEEVKLNEKINFELSMHHLEEGGEYSVLLQEVSNLESDLQLLVDQWSSYKIASAIIERTLNLAKKDRFPQTIKDTTTFFRLLTRGNYQNVLIEEEELLVQRQDGTLFNAFELSKGTAEQLYVALRFAFVKNTSDLVKLPLLIDDGFVNFDTGRKNEMLELLSKMSETTQILYFTFDETINQTYPKQMIEML